MFTTERGLGVINETIELADGPTLHCSKVLRALPGKRHVCEGLFDDRRVVAKSYLDPKRGSIHLQRELAGLSAFAQAGIAAPTVLWHGLDRQGHPVLVVNFIEQAEAVGSHWNTASDERRESLLDELSLLLARHHQAGLCQADVHLGNFLLANGKLYSLDGDAVIVGRQPLAQRSSLGNLALLYAQLTPEWDERSVIASAVYAHERGWASDRVAVDMPRLVERARQKRWRKLRDKLYRDCTAVAHLASGKHDQFVMRAAAEDLRGLLDDPDATCPADASQLLKNGNTATVWRTGLSGRSIVVKRYNVKGFLHGLSRRLKESRASISWRNAHRLRFYGIATPTPLAYAVRNEGMLRPLAYFIADAVDGVSLRDWIENHVEQPELVRSVARKVAQLFALMQRLRISHGDMKASNFILHNERIVVIDLDAMKAHRWKLGFTRAWRRDMARFTANWREMPEIADVFDQELRTALVD